MGKHLVIVGAGHAHLTVLKNLREFRNSGHDITVVSASSHHYYSGMGPGMLSGIYRPEEIRFNVKKMSEDRGAAFVADKVVRVQPHDRKISLQSGKDLSYDVISMNTGSYVPAAESVLLDETVFTVKPIENLLNANRKVSEILKSGELKATVVGGGPTGVEVAGNLDRLVRIKSGRCRITLVAGSRLLKNFKGSVRQRALHSLGGRNVKVLENTRLSAIKNGAVELSDGTVLENDIMFLATGVKPSSLFEDSGLPTGSDGGLLVNQYLQSVSHPEIFGGGDCISYEPQPLAKVGVYAVRQNPILLHNLLSALNGHELQPFKPQKAILLALNLGDGTALVHWHAMVLGGKFGFALKNYIDRKFMQEFQVSGELD